MKYIQHIATCVCLAMLSTSCEKEESPVKLPPPGPSRVMTIAMKTDYSQQAFVDLQSGHATYAPTYVWDLAFSCVPGNNIILTNAGKGVLSYNTHTQNFDSVQSVAGAQWEWDRPQGNPDSLGIGAKWLAQGQSKKEVYLLDLSSSTAANQRYKKMRIEDVNGSSYRIHFAALNGSDSGSFIVNRQPGVNYVYFTFTGGGSVTSYEPLHDAWQLNFTRYKTWVFGLGQYIPYIVTGVLQNPDGVTAIKVENIPFEHITYSYAQTLSFSSVHDVIGYTWKGFNFDFTNAGYQIQQSWTYLLRDSKGIYYKMRFLDFYDENHQKGFPKIEYQQL